MRVDAGQEGRRLLSRPELCCCCSCPRPNAEQVRSLRQGLPNSGTEIHGLNVAEQNRQVADRELFHSLGYAASVGISTEEQTLGPQGGPKEDVECSILTVSRGLRFKGRVGHCHEARHFTVQAGLHC